MPMTDPDVPVLLIVPGFAAPYVIAALEENWTQPTAMHGWQESSFRVAGQDVIAISSPKIFGAMGAAEVTHEALTVYRPELVVVLGFAATLHDDLLLGDVAVASQVDYYFARPKASSTKKDPLLYNLHFGGDVFRPTL